MQKKEDLEKISKAIYEELQRLDLENMLVNVIRSLVKEVLEKKITSVIDDIDFPLLLKTAIKEILEPIILKSVEESIGEKLPILRLIEESRKRDDRELLK